MKAIDKIKKALDSAKAEIVQLTTRDETPGLRYFDFWSKTMGFDVGVGVTITADRSDDLGAYWNLRVVEVWAGPYNLTKHLSGSTSAAIDSEAWDHVCEELNSAEALRRAGIATRKL